MNKLTDLYTLTRVSISKFQPELNLGVDLGWQWREKDIQNSLPHRFSSQSDQCINHRLPTMMCPCHDKMRIHGSDLGPFEFQVFQVMSHVYIMKSHQHQIKSIDHQIIYVNIDLMDQHWLNRSSNISNRSSRLSRSLHGSHGSHGSRLDDQQICTLTWAGKGLPFWGAACVLCRICICRIQDFKMNMYGVQI